MLRAASCAFSSARAFALGLLAERGVVDVERLDLRDIRNGPCARLRVEDHRALIGRSERRPRRKPNAIRIAGLCEVRPVAAHQVRHGDVFGTRSRWRAPGNQWTAKILEDIAD